jgi:hypothetical protein
MVVISDSSKGCGSGLRKQVSEVYSYVLRLQERLCHQAADHHDPENLIGKLFVFHQAAKRKRALERIARPASGKETCNFLAVARKCLAVFSAQDFLFPQYLRPIGNKECDKKEHKQGGAVYKQRQAKPGDKSAYVERIAGNRIWPLRAQFFGLNQGARRPNAHKTTQSDQRKSPPSEVSAVNEEGTENTQIPKDKPQSGNLWWLCRNVLLWIGLLS